MTEFVVDYESTLCCFFANGRSILSIDDRLEDDRHPLPLAAAHAVATNSVNQWN
jgi:hypothetical protein